jgi:hypothetical protein
MDWDIPIIADRLGRPLRFKPCPRSVRLQARSENVLRRAVFGEGLLENGGDFLGSARLDAAAVQVEYRLAVLE